MMKYICLGIVLLIGLTGCEEEKPAAFDEINGIYFNNRQKDNTVTDSTSVTFVYTNDNTMDVGVIIQTLGRPTAQARPVDIRVVGGNAIEGTDYELIATAEIPAETVSCDYLVRLKRTPILKQENRELILELFANDYFILPFDNQVQSGNDSINMVRYRIVFSDRFTVAPESWNERYGGPFSQQKFELICRVLELDPADFNKEGGVSVVKWRFICLEMEEYVATQVKKKEAGEAYDEEAFDRQTGEPFTFEQ